MNLSDAIQQSSGSDTCLCVTCQRLQTFFSVPRMYSPLLRQKLLLSKLKRITWNCYKSSWFSISRGSNRFYTHVTILISDPCEAGSFYSCTTRSCQPCDIGTFQPVWGQTSCWACPPNTTTDTTGSSSPTQCKHTQCVHHSRYDANCQQPGGHSYNCKLHTQ